MAGVEESAESGAADSNCRELTVDLAFKHSRKITNSNLLIRWQKRTKLATKIIIFSIRNNLVLYFSQSLLLVGREHPFAHYIIQIIKISRFFAPPKRVENLFLHQLVLRQMNNCIGRNKIARNAV